MKLFVWETVQFYSPDQFAFAIAKTEEEAKKELAKTDCGGEYIEDLPPAEIYELDTPRAFWTDGGILE